MGTSDNIFITNIEIDKVRHLENIKIPLSINERKHLILTGKNGSGKTSVLEAIKSYLAMYADANAENNMKLLENINMYEKLIKDTGTSTEADRLKSLEYKRYLDNTKQSYSRFYKGAKVELTSNVDVIEAYKKGDFIISYYGADRLYRAEEAQHVEKISLKENYKIDENPGKQLVKYLLDLKTTEALASTSGQTIKASEIKKWFIRFEKLLKEIFNDDKLELSFNIDTFKFSIIESGREPFDFNNMSSGYAAVLDIIVDIMMRMEKNVRGFYNIQGVVLIDEVETHLHIELQRKILPFLINMFPNIQFIVSTHSPFILTSISDVVIYDLEKKIIVDKGMQNLPYAGVVEGYFGADTLSKSLKEKFERYKEIVSKKTLEDEDYVEIAELEFYLDEIPDYLALDITTEYQKIKLEKGVD